MQVKQSANIQLQCGAGLSGVLFRGCVVVMHFLVVALNKVYLLGLPVAVNVGCGMSWLAERLGMVCKARSVSLSVPQQIGSWHRPQVQVWWCRYHCCGTGWNGDLGIIVIAVCCCKRRLVACCARVC